MSPITGKIRNRIRSPRQIALTAGCVVLLLAFTPLFLDWFLAIPWSLRRLFGFVVVPSGLALASIYLVRNKSALQISFDPLASQGSSRTYRGLFWRWLPILATSSLAFPLLQVPDGIGAFSDWDQFLQKYEAIRLTILQYHQFPWWNPWRRGGFPLAADPETGVLSLTTLLVLVFGTSTGLRLAAILHVAIAAEGARRLAHLFLGDGIGAAAAGIIYSLNGAAQAYLAGGFFVPMSYSCVPWLFYSVFRLDRVRWAGMVLGFWTSFALLNGIQYPTIHALAIVAVIWLLRLFQPGCLLRDYLFHSLTAAGIVLATCGWRIVAMADLVRDYPRKWDSLADLSWPHFLRGFMERPNGGHLVAFADRLPWEAENYIGPIVCGLGLISLTRGLRWWHGLAAFCFACALGTRWWYQPSFWLNELPVFSSMHTVGRWRIIGMLGLALAVGSVLARWQRSQVQTARLAASLLTFCLTVDYLLLSWNLLPVAFMPRDSSTFPFPETSKLVNLENWPKSASTVHPPPPLLSYQATCHGYGVIRAHEALLGYDRNLPTSRLWVGHPDYISEAWSGNRPIVPLFWSPNRLLFDVTPGAILQLNINPGSWWLVNGERVHGAMRCVEWNVPFAVPSSPHGIVDLRICPPHPMAMFWITVFGIVLFTSGILSYRSGGVTARPARTELTSKHRTQGIMHYDGQSLFE